MDKKSLHVAIVSSPGTGHLIPVLLLGNRLATHHRLHVTILAVTTATSPAESQLIHSFTANSGDHINVIKIPLQNISAVLRPDAAVVTQLAVMMRETRHSIRSTISGMSHRPDVLIGDLFSTESFPIADEFHMQKYAYVPTSAWSVALTTYCHVLDKEVQGQYVDEKEPLKIPGCKPVRPEDVVDPMLDRNDQQYDEYVKMGINFTTLCDGILVNTWRDMDRESLDALKYNEMLRSVVKVPVYDIGPLTRQVELESAGSHEVIKWLDMQPVESVLFVSFGSGGTLSAEQITELAWGLELSHQRFVWVVRAPTRSSVDDPFFTSGIGSNELLGCVPDGFLNRTQKLGLVVPSWAPQVQILNHRSVGWFLSHCGMNSTLESVKCGVPMIAWPLYAEQRLNATLLTEELRVAVRPEVSPTKMVVGREEIGKMVRSLMKSEEGKAMRERMKVLRDSANAALEINGSSWNSMCEFIKNCEMKMNKSK